MKRMVLAAGLTAVFLGLAGSSEAVTVDFTLTGTASGSGSAFFSPCNPVSWTVPSCELNPLSDWTAAFVVGGVTYDKAHYADKFNHAGVDIGLVEGGVLDGLDWYWDDAYNVVADSGIVSFGGSDGSRLFFDEGDLGARTYFILDAAGGPAGSGTYSANLGKDPEPVPEPGTLALLGGGLLAGARRLRRRRS